MISSKNKIRFLIRFNILIGLLAFSSLSHAAQNDRQAAVVKEVLEGSRVRLAGGQTLSYAGIQAPPMQSMIPLVREYGQASFSFNKALVEGKTIQVEWGAQIRDERNNLLGYVFLDDGTFVNEALLKAGHAKRRVEPPNIRYAERFRQVELEARRQKQGLWREEPDNPYLKSEFIGEKSTKVYYYPTSPELEGIPEAHLAHFRTRMDAIAAGFKPCATCRDENPSDDY
ncbi:MAG: thermonuclease family protein [Candidatus Omnitrophica bacterium]|nr:thermonuclease family protein [Candidatus Omnitrophota bacterium]